MAPPVTAYPHHRPGSAIFYPLDEGWHSNIGPVANPHFDLQYQEWLYLNSHLVGQRTGRRYTVFTAYFTQWLRFLTVQRFDANWVFEKRAATSDMGILTPRTGQLDLTFKHLHGEDRWVADPSAPFEQTLHAVQASTGLEIDLRLSAVKPPSEVADIGYVAFGTRGWTYYYSLPRMAVTGTVRMPGEAPEEVRGIAWEDHQWGPFSVAPYQWPGWESYEWFSVQLEDGRELMIDTVWTPDGTTPPRAEYGGLVLIDREGAVSGVAAPRIERVRFWRDERHDVYYASQWRVRVPELAIDLTLTPRAADQLAPVPDALPGLLPAWVLDALPMWVRNAGNFWEGTCDAVGTIAGKEVRGDAFAELLHRYPVPHVEIDAPALRGEATASTVVLGWRVPNWDEGHALVYDVYVGRHDGEERQVAGGLVANSAAVDGPWEKGVPYVVRVVARSGDRTLQGESSRIFTL